MRRATTGSFARAAAASALAGALLGGGVARAAPPPSDREACDDAFSSGPELIKKGRLLDARAALARCATAPCPSSMRPLCAEDLRHVEERIPTAVFIAKDPKGQDILDARVTERGAVVAAALDGRSLPVDPGPHTFHFERADGSSADADVVMHEGERERAIPVTLAEAEPTVPGSPPAVPPGERLPAAPAPASSAARPVPWTVFAAGGLTAAAAASFGVFGGIGVSERSGLQGCKGSCSAESVDRVTRDYLAANVSLGVAAGALILTTILYLTRPAASPPRAALRVSF